MAVTKIKAIRGTLSKAIAYILNPEKTDEKLLVSSYGCASETAAREFEWTRKIAEQKGMNPVRIIARHVIQSFDIGEVSPELAHKIGKQFADEILGGKYEYVLTTHIDKDHVHNHLIFNAVDFVDYHAYKSYKRIYYDMREVSDRLCKENDGDLAGNGLCQSGTGFASCGVAVKTEEHFSGVLAFRKETVKGFARNAAQGKIISCLPILRIKADKR